MLHRSLIAAAALGLASCATPYAPMGYAGGFESNWLSPNTLSVTVMGNGFTNARRVREMALVQSAERARESGYCYFVFGGSVNQSSVTQTYMPGSTTTTTTGTVTGNSFYGTSTTSGGGYYMPVFRPGETLTVRMFSSPPPGFRPGQYYDVAQIINGEIGARYLSDASRAIPVTCTASDAGAPPVSTPAPK